MPKKRIKVKKDNLKVGIIFSVVIALLIGFSLIGKLASVLEQGKYDDNYPMSLKVEGKYGVQFLSIFPKEHEISVLNVSGGREVSESLAIAPEAEVIAGALSVEPSDTSSFFHAILRNEEVKTNLTAVDKFRLYLLSKSIAGEDVTVEDVSVSGEAADKIISSLFSDSGITSEGLRVEVVNATGVYGIGNKVARIISNIGTDVVFVSTADNTEEECVIYYQDDKTYTVKRLARTLGFRTVKNAKRTISDITVVIGENGLKSINP
ncbi:MAG: LytR C-terminal domain-containing protein [Candidatus Levyibacteriota bacterium]